MADFTRLMMLSVRSLAGCVFLLMAAIALLRVVTTTQSWADLLRWPAVAYVLVALILLVAFALVMPTRRRLALLVLLFLLVLLKHVEFLALSWSRIASIMVAMVVVIFVTEVVRQNVGLVLELRKYNLGRKSLNAFLIWLPFMGGAVWFGDKVGNWLSKTSIQMIYDQTPIDQYCKKGSGLTPESDLLDRVPCEGLNWAKPPVVKELLLPARLEHHLAKMYRSKQQQMLEHIASPDHAKRIPDTVFMDARKLKAALAEIDALTSAVVVLAIPGSSNVTDKEALARDPVLQRMIQERRHILSQMQQGSRLSRAMATVVGNEQLKRLDPQIAQRRQAVLNASMSVRTTERIIAGSVQDQLLRRLPPVAPFPGPRILPVKQARDVAAVRSRLAALVVHRLFVQEKESLKQAGKITDDINAERQKNASGIPRPEEQFEKIGFKRMCSNFAMSPDVVKEDLSDLNGKPAPDLEYMPVNNTVFPCSTDPTLPDGTYGEPLGLNESLDASIRQWTIDNEARLESSIRDTLVAIVIGGGTAGSKAQNLASMVPESIHLGRKRCRTIEPHTWGNCATNWGKEKAEKSYASGRLDAGREYRLAVDKSEREAQGGAAGVVLFERDNGRKQLLQAEESLHKSVRTIASIVHVISWVFLLLLVLTLIKSLLYVQALFLFHFHGRAVIQVNRDANIVGDPPRTATQGQELLFSGVNDLDRLVNQVEMDGQLPRIILAPWPTSGVMARLLRFKYFAYHSGGPVYPDKPMAWQCPDGHNIVDWELQRGEEVVFKYKHFAGASRSLVLRSHVSLRLDTMLLGRFTFHSAWARDAPGHLLLQTKVLSRYAVEHDAIESAVPERIVAWHAQTGFTAAHQLNAWSLIMDRFALVRKPVSGVRGRILVESSNSRAMPFAGLARHILMVLSPI